MASRPTQPIIGGRREAVLDLLGWLCVLGGVAVTSSRNAVGGVIIVLGVFLLAAFLLSVDRRLNVAKGQRSILRRLLGTAAIYCSLLMVRDGHDDTVHATVHPPLNVMRNPRGCSNR